MTFDSTGGNTNQNWSVECSDDENYFEPSDNYRISSDGTRIWEPSGVDIVRLYEEIEANGFNKLEWQCPGRISPSQLNQDANDGQYSQLDDSNSLTNQTKSKFDFDNEFDDASFKKTSNTRVAKRAQGLFCHLFTLLALSNINSKLILHFIDVKKSQTNLSKVMLDIKKYQMIDQKGIKTKVTNTSGVSVQTSQAHTMPSMTNNNTSLANRLANSSVQHLAQELDEFN